MQILKFYRKIPWEMEQGKGEGSGVCFTSAVCLCQAMLFLGLKSSAVIKVINALIKILLNNIKETIAIYILAHSHVEFPLRLAEGEAWKSLPKMPLWIASKSQFVWLVSSSPIKLSHPSTSCLLSL